MSKVIFIDWSVFMFRAIFASLHNTAVPSVYTAFAMIISNLKKIGVTPDDRIIIACDKGKSWRKSVDCSYKAQRKAGREKFPIDWDKQFASFDWLLGEVDKATSWNVVGAESLEADDWMAVGSRFFVDNEVILITTDSDLEQMWKYKNVKIFSPIKKCAGKSGKGAYKIPPPDFNVYKLLSQKIRKETADNLVNPILSQEDYDKRKQIVSLLELPDNIENTIRERLANLKNKETNIELLPFKSIRERFKTLYNTDKIVTYKESMKKRKKRRKKK